MATSSKTKKLDEHRRKLAEAIKAEREIAAMSGRLRAQAEDLAKRLADGELPVDGSPPAPGTDERKLWDELQAVKIKLTAPWERRRERAAREVAHRESELARFAEEHFGELVAEIEPQAEKVAAGVDEAMENLVTAFAD